MDLQTVPDGAAVAHIGIIAVGCDIFAAFRMT
jgi:hypothetical protein